MDEPGETLFSYATLAGDQDIRVGARNASGKVDQPAHGRAEHTERRLVIGGRRGGTCSFHSLHQRFIRGQRRSKPDTTICTRSATRIEVVSDVCPGGNGEVYKRHVNLSDMRERITLHGWRGPALRSRGATHDCP